MARTAITPTVVDRSGTVNMPALAAMDATNNNSLKNNGRVLINVKNSGASTYTLTIPLPAADLPDSQPGSALAFASGGVQYSLTAGASIVLGPFPPGIYNQSDGTIWLNPQNASLQALALELD